jgi:hypothetical protein
MPRFQFPLEGRIPRRVSKAFTGHLVYDVVRNFPIMGRTDFSGDKYLFFTQEKDENLRPGCVRFEFFSFLSGRRGVGDF